MSDELEVGGLEDRIALLDAVAAAVASGNPSPLNGLRADARRRLLELRPEDEGDEDRGVVLESDEEVREAQKPGADLEAIEAARDDEDRWEDEGGTAPADEDEEELVVNATPVDEFDGPGEAQRDSDEAAEDANPAAIDARGDVGANRPEVTDERRDENVEALKPHEDTAENR